MEGFLQSDLNIRECPWAVSRLGKSNCLLSCGKLNILVTYRALVRKKIKLGVFDLNFGKSLFWIHNLFLNKCLFQFNIERLLGSEQPILDAVLDFLALQNKRLERAGLFLSHEVFLPYQDSIAGA